MYFLQMAVLVVVALIEIVKIIEVVKAWSIPWSKKSYAQRANLAAIYLIPIALLVAWPWLFDGYR